MSRLDTATANHLARIALGHVECEFPNNITHLMTGPEDAQRPCQLHPVFFGSFDWHSCVHSYWLLAHLAATGLLSQANQQAIRALFERRITPQAVAGELAYFKKPARAGFERPYGWAWLVKLAGELIQHSEPVLARAGQILGPLTDHIVQLWQDYWPKQTYPIRAGVHSNSALATIFGLEYARATAQAQLAQVLSAQALAWYAQDQSQPAWEPGGDEFLSPALIEALAMQQILPQRRFRRWFAAYLPALDKQQPPVLFQPAQVSDRSDGKLAHLDGLNLTRSWCWYQLATSLEDDEPCHGLMQQAGHQHLQAAMAHLESDYMGSHWLASFALLALEAAPAGQGSA